MKIGGYEIPIRFNSKAMIDIEELINGDVDKLSEYIGAEGISTGTTVKRVAEIITILANGYVFTHNQDIDTGFKQGDKKPFYTIDFFLAHLDINDMGECMNSIKDEMYKGTAVSVPEGVKFAEEDEVLAEIEEIKNQ